MPLMSPSGMSSVCAVAEADDLGGDVARRRRPAAIVADLADLGLEAGGLDDEADEVADAAVAAVQVGLVERVGGGRVDARRGHAVGAHRLSSATQTTSRARSSLRAQAVASTSPAAVRTIAPPRRDAALGLDLECSMPPSVAGQVVDRVAHEARGRRG